MKERPILFSTEMVQAILAGRKTQTRRVVKDKLLQSNKDEFEEEFLLATMAKCPYGQVGDVLWVRETWQPSSSGAYVHFKADWADEDAGKGWKPSIHMPKDAARIWLRITNIRVERLQNISEDDAKAEGIVPDRADIPFKPQSKFFHLWESINGEQSWNDNPFVWVIEFEVIEKP